METPEWFVKGKTHLLPKNKKTDMEINYKPITCPNSMYKCVTSIMTARLYAHLEGNNPFTTRKNKQIGNLLYIDDLKLIAKYDSELKTKLKIMR